MRFDVDEKQKKEMRELDKAIAEIVAETPEERKKAMAQAKKENPHLTDEQIENLFAQGDHQLGL